MSTSDAAPLPKLGEVFFDVRGEERTMRLSWYADTGIAVFSIWHGGICTGTFRLPMADLPRMIESLRGGPHTDGADALAGPDEMAGRRPPARRRGQRRRGGHRPRGPQDEIETGQTAGYQDGTLDRHPTADGPPLERLPSDLPGAAMPGPAAAAIPDAPTSVYPGGGARSRPSRPDYGDDPLGDVPRNPRSARRRSDPLSDPLADLPAPAGGYRADRPGDPYAGAEEGYRGYTDPGDSYPPDQDEFPGAGGEYTGPGDGGFPGDGDQEGLAGDQYADSGFGRHEPARDSGGGPRWDEERGPGPGPDGRWDDEPGWDDESEWDDGPGRERDDRWDTESDWDDESRWDTGPGPAGGRHNAPPPESFPYGPPPSDRRPGPRGRHPGRH